MSATSTVSSEPEPPLDRNIVRRCCALKVSGDQCRQSALRGHNYCTTHIDREPHVFARPGHIIIPLLDDPAAVQLTATKVVSALANGTMKPDVANAINRSLNTAARTFPRPPRLKPGQSEPRQQPALFTVDDNGAWVAPPQPWLDDSGNIITYDQLAARLNPNQVQPHPATAVTHSYKQLITDLIRQKFNREKAESAAALAAGFPDPHAENLLRFSNSRCPFSIPFCDGPADPEPCMFCRGDLHMQPTAPQYPGDDVLALIVALRTHIQQQKGCAQRAPAEARQEAPHTGAPAEERAFRPASATPKEAAPENSAPQPAFALDLKATANTPRAPRCRPQRRSPIGCPILVAQRFSARQGGPAKGAPQATAHRLQPAACSHVVKFVNQPNYHIPNNKNLAQPQKHQISPNAERRNAERRTPNAERRTPNAERRTPNAERRTPNAERRTPNAERRTPNAERRTPNAEPLSRVIPRLRSHHQTRRPRLHHDLAKRIVVPLIRRVVANRIK